MTKQLVAIAGALFLIVGAVLLMISVSRGRRIAQLIAQRHPQFYETLGRPLPGYFHSMRRSRFDQLILQRKYLELQDRDLIDQCERLRKTNMRMLYFIVGGLALFGTAALWYEWWG